MNILFNLSSKPISFFNESMSIPLTAQQQKVIAIVGLAMACLAACYAISRVCCFSGKKISEAESSEKENQKNLNNTTISSEDNELSDHENLDNEGSEIDQSLSFGQIYQEPSAVKSQTPKNSGKYSAKNGNYSLLNSNPLLKKQSANLSKEAFESPSQAVEGNGNNSGYLTPFVAKRKRGQSKCVSNSISGNDPRFGDCSPIQNQFTPILDDYLAMSKNNSEAVRPFTESPYYNGHYLNLSDFNDD